MMEVRTKVQPIKVELHCDHCGSTTRHTGTRKGQNIYACKACGFEYLSKQVYPRIDYEPVDMDPERKYLPHISDK